MPLGWLPASSVAYVENGKLLATARGDKAHLNAYLDDHAFIFLAMLELLQADDFRKPDLDFAIALAEALLARFQDDENGGFFFTSHYHERLIQRKKSAYDNATPSGNAIAALALQRLGHLVGERRYLDAAKNTLRAFSETLWRNPAACPSLVMALEEYLIFPPLLILRGPQEEMSGWKEVLKRLNTSGLILIFLPEDSQGIPPSLDRPLMHDVNAWLCRDVEYLPAIDHLDIFLERLRPLCNRGETRL